MPLDGDSVDDGDLGEALCPEPSCSTPACDSGPFSPSSLHAEPCRFPCIVFVPGTIGGDEKRSYPPNKRKQNQSAHSPSASASLSSCPLCPEAFSPSIVQRSMKGRSRISLHLWNPVCVISTKQEALIKTRMFSRTIKPFHM